VENNSQVRLRFMSHHVAHVMERPNKPLQIRTALFWVITQQAVVIPYRLFGTIWTGLPETSEVVQNVGKESPLRAAQQPRRARFSSTSRWKPETTQISADIPILEVTC
jgi:hypothetical protein